jgi:hypothetical protein
LAEANGLQDNFYVKIFPSLNEANRPEANKLMKAWYAVVKAQDDRFNAAMKAQDDRFNAAMKAQDDRFNAAMRAQDDRFNAAMRAQEDRFMKLRNAYATLLYERSEINSRIILENFADSFAKHHNTNQGCTFRPSGNDWSTSEALKHFPSCALVNENYRQTLKTILGPDASKKIDPQSTKQSLYAQPYKSFDLLSKDVHYFFRANDGYIELPMTGDPTIRRLIASVAISMRIGNIRYRDKEGEIRDIDSDISSPPTSEENLSKQKEQKTMVAGWFVYLFVCGCVCLLLGVFSYFFSILD